MKGSTTLFLVLVMGLAVLQVTARPQDGRSTEHVELAEEDSDIATPDGDDDEDDSPPDVNYDDDDDNTPYDDDDDTSIPDDDANADADDDDDADDDADAADDGDDDASRATDENSDDDDDTKPGRRLGNISGNRSGSGSDRSSEENSDNDGTDVDDAPVCNTYPAVSSGCPKPKDCADLLDLGFVDNGVYTVYAGTYNKPVQVYCDMETNGGGWTIIQRRLDGFTDFARDWEEYANGFGDLYQEFWLGNHLIHLLSTQKAYRLRVDVEDFESEARYAEYAEFSVGAPFENYPLTLTGYQDTSTADDSLSMMDGGQFSTPDVDNDNHVLRHFASMSSGGWWWTTTWIMPHLNGEYQGGAAAAKGEGIKWPSWKGRFYSLKTSVMAIKPITSTVL